GVRGIRFKPVAVLLNTVGLVPLQVSARAALSEFLVADCQVFDFGLAQTLFDQLARVRGSSVQGGAVLEFAELREQLLVLLAFQKSPAELVHGTLASAFEPAEGRCILQVVAGVVIGVVDAIENSARVLARKN